MYTAQFQASKMNQLIETRARINRLPKYISDRILMYLINMVGINAELSEDIRHVVRCKCMLQASRILCYTEEIVEKLRHYQLLKKYNRKIRVLFERPQNDLTIPLNEYPNLVYYKSCLDHRPNKHSLVVSKFMTTSSGIEDEYMQYYRVLHNVVCAVSPGDRAKIMSAIEDYVVRILPYEMQEYDDYYDAYAEYEEEEYEEDERY
jgi:hypothetical protein